MINYDEIRCPFVEICKENGEKIIPFICYMDEHYGCYTYKKEKEKRLKK